MSALQNTPMNNTGKRTDVGRGLAHMLRQYQAGQMGRQMDTEQAENEQMVQADNKSFGQAMENYQTGGMNDMGGPMRAGQMPIAQTPEGTARSAAFQQAMMMRGLDQQDAMELQGKRNERSLSFGDGRLTSVERNFRALYGKDRPETPEEQQVMFNLARSSKFGDTGGGMQEMNRPIFSGQPSLGAAPSVPEATQGGVRSALEGAATLQTPNPQSASGGARYFTKTLPPDKELDYVEKSERVKAIGKGEGTKDLEFGAAKSRLEGIKATSQELINAVDQLSELPGLTAATGASAVFDPRNFLPGTDAGDANFKLANIKNKVFINTLQSMREMSKTGGAVGNVSDKEGDRLENAIVALQSSQTEKQFMVELANLRRVTVEGQQRLQNALQAEYGSRVQVDADASSLSDDDLFN